MHDIPKQTSVVEWPRLHARSAFDRYEQWRYRCPPFDSTIASKGSAAVSGVLELLDEIDVFVFDAFGVLNTGEVVIDNAAATVSALRTHGKRVFVLSNGASNNRAASLQKLLKMGFDFSHEELLSSRDVCETGLAGFPPQWRWGVIGRDDFTPEQLSVDSVLLADDKNHYDRADAFLFLSTAHWSNTRQALLEASLAENTRTLVIANPDVVAPFPSGFSIEPGYFGHLIADQFGLDCHNVTAAEKPVANSEFPEPVIRFFGKPFADVYTAMTEQIAQAGYRDSSRICMVGDTLHTDILGGHAAGWRTALVTDHGLFANMDVAGCIQDSGIVPDWIMPSIG